MLPLTTRAAHLSTRPNSSTSASFAKERILAFCRSFAIADCGNAGELRVITLFRSQLGIKGRTHPRLGKAACPLPHLSHLVPKPPFRRLQHTCEHRRTQHKATSPSSCDPLTVTSLSALAQALIC
ncbi:hypothetical protein CBOM_07560 [Ceraceosorus bombacis]|uniref:Uncharacterized protein n=1 Tax=Ceraceosorus bombacis TaxID=401625 RepID=A0A0P1BG54_9BASI|nr:hypothetical protein CBOM_07560 [Ceraceosorus bombacis]